MKKSFLLLAVLCICIGSTFAQKITLKTTTGQTLSGTFVDATDTTLTILFGSENLSAQPLTLPASRIQSGKLPHKGKISVQDGKIIIQTSEDLKTEQTLKMSENPNCAIGKALKAAGSTSLAVGVPCLAAGLATCIAGNVMHVSKYGTGLTTKSQLIETSYYLLPIGASLTIVGIPLYVEGKKIMELKVNYTGNGVGLSMNF